MRIVIDILIVISILFALAGTIGIIRMPDAYTRMQSSTNISTMGILGVLIAAILYSIIYLKDTSMAIKLAVLIVFYLSTNAIGGHAIAKAAYRSRVKPSEKTVCDQYGADLIDKEGNPVDLAGPAAKAAKDKNSGDPAKNRMTQEGMSDE